jgi:hypothetical protein
MPDKPNKPRNRCGEFKEKVPEFLDGSLHEDEFLFMEAHRRECADCAKALFEEERMSLLMAEIPNIRVPSDFRDRVIRAWRLRRDRVKDALPVSTLRLLQVVFVVFVVVLLALPAARISLLSAASNLSSALDNLPPEYRQGVRISFELPSYAETVATAQTWQGKIFESLGNLGSALAPWTGWLWAGLVFSAVVASGWLWKLHKIGAVHPFL